MKPEEPWMKTAPAQSGLTQSLLPAGLRRHMALLLPNGRTVRYEPRQKVFGEGDVSDHIAIILSGVVKITVSTSNGREALLGLRGAGEIVGELGALYGSLRSATVRALDDVQARLVAASVFRQRLRDNPDALFAVLEAVIGRLRESDRRRMEFTGSDVLERVSLLLAELAHTHGNRRGDGVVTIDLRLSQQEIAEATSASREAVAKALKELRAQDIVRTARQRIVVLKPEALLPA
jgi:CRP/FNR family cyclic AMP-dependent transcriptional regulator